MRARITARNIHQLVLLAWCGVLLSAFAVQGEDRSPINALPSNQELDAVREWFSQNPYNVESLADRRQRMTVIQKACDRLPPETFWEYVKAWQDNPQRADELETEGALYYLRRARDAAIQEIRRTKVTKGVAIWHLYNMGYVFKTPAACLGIDLFLRDGKDLAPDLDFLLVTHEHLDHRSSDLIAAMIAAKKPVVTSFECGGTTVTQACEFTFGPVRVKVDIGDHHKEDPAQRDNMLMYQVDCGMSGNNCVIYHSGDGNNALKMTPDKPVDIFIVHVQVGMPVKEAIRHLKPKVTLVSHVLELGHSLKPPAAWRWSYDYAFQTVRSIPPDEAIILTWGEQWLMPGSQIEKQRGGQR